MSLEVVWVPVQLRAELALQLDWDCLMLARAKPGHQVLTGNTAVGYEGAIAPPRAAERGAEQVAGAFIGTAVSGS